jgi:hypothetical protein
MVIFFGLLQTSGITKKSSESGTVLRQRQIAFGGDKEFERNNARETLSDYAKKTCTSRGLTQILNDDGLAVTLLHDFRVIVLGRIYLRTDRPRLHSIRREREKTSFPELLFSILDPCGLRASPITCPIPRSSPNISDGARFDNQG